MVQHQTEQELHAHLLKNFTQVFDCQLIGHEVKLKAGIVDFVGEADDTLYLIEIKRDKIQRDTIVQMEKYMDAFKQSGFKEITPKKYKNIVGIVAAPSLANHIKNTKLPNEIKILTLQHISHFRLDATRINVWVEPALYHKLKVQAALENVTLKEFVIATLQEKLKQK